MAQHGARGRSERCSRLPPSSNVCVRPPTQQIGALDEFDHGGAIGRRISDVRHIGDFLPRRDGHHASQRTESPFATFHAGRNPGHMVIRSIFDDGAFELVQPRSDGQLEFQKLVFPDIGMRGFLNCEGKARRAMIETGR